MQVEMRVVRLAFRFQQFGRILHERDADLVRPGAHWNPRLQMLIDHRIILIFRRLDRE